ncbi:MAG: sterol desaturase family protein [Pseudomonadota bacterium]
MRIQRIAGAVGPQKYRYARPYTPSQSDFADFGFAARETFLSCTAISLMAITMENLNVPLLVLAAAALMWLVEWWAPAFRRPLHLPWVLRAALLNGAQAATAFLGALTWEHWFAHPMAWSGGLATGVGVGYLLITFVYYWWHRARHRVSPLWRYVHRLHHSPARIEIITSFYKHPIELVLNGILTSALLTGLLGLDAQATALTVLITGLAELFYHWNIRTPRWLGWFFQRPEMHRVHHERGRHTCNFSDLPLWDALFGTLHNPRGDVPLCGFPDENRLGCLLLGRPVREV